MNEDKRIEWCKKHCIDISEDSYIENLDFNDQYFIKIDTSINDWFYLNFNGTELPEFIDFKVKESCELEADIYLEKCPNLKSLKGLPTDHIENVWLGSEIENTSHISMNFRFNYDLIKDTEEGNRANKRLRTKLWQNFQSEVLMKLQEQNPEIDISDYADGIEWLAIHDRDFYRTFLAGKVSLKNIEINIDNWIVFESITNYPLIIIKTEIGCSINIDDEFNYSDGEKLINNIIGKKEIYLPQKESQISEDDFLKFVEEKTKQSIIESNFFNKKNCTNK